MLENPVINVDTNKNIYQSNEASFSKVINQSISRLNIVLKYEYLTSTFISVFLWSYCIISLALKLNSVLTTVTFQKEDFIEVKTYFTRVENFSEIQWTFYHKIFIIQLIYALLFVMVSKYIKTKYSIDEVKKFYIASGIVFGFYLAQGNFIYIFITSIIFYLINFIINLIGGKSYELLCITLMIFIKYLVNYLKRKVNLKILDNSFFPNMDALSWELFLIFNLFKMISFNFEYEKNFYNENINNSIFSIDQARGHCYECLEGNFCLNCLNNASIFDKTDFSFLSYLSYVFYPPLLYCGPIINYNNFVFQLKFYSQSEHKNFIRKDKIIYAVILCAFTILMELHNYYINPCGFFTIKEIYNFLTFSYYCVLEINILVFHWLKFCIIWKTGRLWAWFDAIYTEENINRFVCDIYSIEEFFRGFNRSLYKWVIRYLYIPLGGRDKKYFNIWLIFGFFYFLFDYSNWSFIVFFIFCGFIIIENILKERIFENDGDTIKNNQKMWIRYTKYLVCTIYLIILYLLGLIAFGIGFSGVKGLFTSLYESRIFFRIIEIILFLLPNVIMIFYIRDMEYQERLNNNEKVLNY